MPRLTRLQDPPLFIDAIIQTAGALLDIRFGLDFELSLVQTNVFTRGFALALDAEVDLAGLAGVRMHCTAHFRPPPSMNLMSFAIDPSAILEIAGIALGAEVDLPFGIGYAKFEGALSARELRLNTSVAVDIVGIGFGFAVSILANGNILETKLAARASIGPFANLDIYGTLCAGSACANEGLITRAELNARLIIFQVVGRVDIELTTTAPARIYFNFQVAFCGFGLSIGFEGLMKADLGFFLETKLSLSLLGFSADATLQIGWSFETGMPSFAPSVTLGLPGPLGQVTFGWKVRALRSHPVSPHNPLLPPSTILTARLDHQN